MTIVNHSEIQSFPVPASSWAGGELFHPTEGMTYRSWLIGQALSALSNPVLTENWHPANYAAMAIDIADAIIDRLNGDVVD